MYPNQPDPLPSSNQARPPSPPRPRLTWLLLRVVQNTLLVVVLLWAAFLLLRGLFNLLNSPDLGAVLLQILLLTAYLAFFLTAQFVFFYFVLSRTRTIWRRPSQLNARRSTVYLSPPVADSIAHTVTLVQSVRSVPPQQPLLLGGMLLAGEGGTGTRHVAEIIAAEAGVPLGYINAASLRSSRLGLDPFKVANAYRRARKFAREYGACVVLLEGFDALASPANRADSSGVLHEILIQIDPPPPATNWLARILRWLPFQAAPIYAQRVLTICTVHALEALDPAIRHDSRFAHQLVLTAPDATARRVWVQTYLHQLGHAPLQIEPLIAATEGSSLDQIKRVLDAAAVYARAAQHSQIDQSDLDRALAGFTAAAPAAPPPPTATPEASTLPLTATEQRRLAIYRAGQVYAWSQLLPHSPSNEVLVSLDLADEPDVLSDTLDTLLTPESLQQGIFSRTELLRGLQLALAGNAATNVLLNEQTTAAAPDLRRATQLASLLIGAWGMGESLLVYPAADPYTTALEPQVWASLAPQITTLLERTSREVAALLNAHRETVQALADALLLRGKLTLADVDVLLGGLEPPLPPAPAAPVLVAHRYVPRPTQPLTPPREPAAVDLPLAAAAVVIDAVPDAGPDPAPFAPPEHTPEPPPSTAQPPYTDPTWGQRYSEWGPPPPEDEPPSVPR